MSEQERIEGFGREFNELMQKYGVSIGVELVPEALGPVIQVRAQTKFVSIPNWQPSERPVEIPDFVKTIFNGHQES